jgi:phage gpG-like protein
MRLDATVDMRDVLAGIEAMKKRGLDLRPVWKFARQVMRADVGDHFNDRSGPGGSWPARAASTEERVKQSRGAARRRRAKYKSRGIKSKLRARPTKLLGRLRGAWLFEATPESLTMRSRVPWADVHQTGGRAGKGGRSGIPARPFAYLSPAAVVAVSDRIQKFLVEPW